MILGNLTIQANISITIQKAQIIINRLSYFIIFSPIIIINFILFSVKLLQKTLENLSKENKKKFLSSNIGYKERMNAMKTFGLPKGLLYYHYNILWKSFFDVLDISYIESKNSTKEIIEKEKCIDETCLSLNIFLGHIERLKDKCDMILIPRIYSIEKKNKFVLILMHYMIY